LARSDRAKAATPVGVRLVLGFALGGGAAHHRESVATAWKQPSRWRVVWSPIRGGGTATEKSHSL
jgi:hypothetical protein